MPWRVAVVALALVGAVPLPAHGQALWGTVALPGGAKAARISLNLGAGSERPDALWLLDFVERYTALSNGEIGAVSDRYFRFMASVSSVFREASAGCRLPRPGSARADVDQARECLVWLGLRLRERDGALVCEPDASNDGEERRGWLAAAGIDAIVLASEVNAGRVVRAALEDSELPLPLPAYWRDVVFSGDRPAIASITLEARTALLYRALFSLDDDTLEHFAKRPALLGMLTLEMPGTFAMFGRSVRVSGGAIRLPGGDPAARTWARLVGVPPALVDDFILELLRRDDGRLAYFYDAVARLDPAHQRFVLDGASGEGASDPLVDRVYGVFKSFDPSWRTSLQPFQLREFDPAIAVAFVGVQSDGTIGPAWWPSLLERVTGSSDWPDRPEQTLGRLRDGRADAAWFLHWVFDRPAEARSRFELARHLQRRFPDAPLDLAPALEIALRTRHELPALSLALERMDVRDPALIGRLGRVARDLTASGPPHRVLPVLARWQSAFGVMEQAHRLGGIAPDVLAGLVGSLADETPAKASDADGIVAAWVVEHLLPALSGAVEPRGEMEWIEAALRPAAAAPHLATWEGLSYQLDRWTPATRAIGDIRAARPGPELADLVSVQEARRRLEAGVSSLEAIADLAGDFEALGRRLADFGGGPAGAFDSADDSRVIAGNLRRITAPRDVDRAAREIPRVIRLTDTIADVVLPPLLYAMAAAPTSQPAALYGDTWTRHVMDRPPPGGVRPWAALAWEVPSIASAGGAGTGVRGSYVALDAALADAQLPNAPSDELLAPAVMFERDRLALVESLLLRRPEADTGDLAVDPVAAIARGRARVAGWTTTAPFRAAVRQALQSAGVSELRVNLILWIAGRHPEALGEWIRITDYYWLGGGPALPAAWGVAGRAIDGCLCFEPLGVEWVPWLRDRGASGLAGAFVTDMPLRLAELLRELQLPATLVPFLLPNAVREWIARTWQIMPTDALALGAFPASLPSGRIDDYLLSLVANRFLVAPDGGLPWER
jgi:hypothetical protein